MLRQEILILIVKQISNWVKDEKVIRKQKQNTKAGRYCKPLYSLMEGKLHGEFLELRKGGQSVKRWWFNTRAKQLITEHHPDITTFNASDGWFNRFCYRKNVSFWRKTHKSKTTRWYSCLYWKLPRQSIKKIRRGSYNLCDLANIAQTPLPFVLEDNKNYAINKPFKDRVHQAFEEHLHKNLQLYTEGKLTASDKRVLIMKLVGDAWSVIKEEKEMIIWSFVECGLSNKLDGSEDHYGKYSRNRGLRNAEAGERIPPG